MFKRGCANILNFQKLSHPALRFAFRMNVGLKLFETFTLESFRNYTIFTYVSTLYLAPEFLLQIRLSDTEFHSNATRMANRNSLGFGMVHCMQLLGFFGNKVLLRISNLPMMCSSSKGSSRALCPGNKTRYRASGGSTTICNQEERLAGTRSVIIMYAIFNLQLRQVELVGILEKKWHSCCTFVSSAISNGPLPIFRTFECAICRQLAMIVKNCGL